MSFVIQHLNLVDAVLLNVGIWLVGPLGAIVWGGFGRETGRGRGVAISSAE